MSRRVRALAAATPRLVGSPWAFLMAIFLTVAWLVWGVVVGFSDRWLLVPSAIASVATFVIAFSLQHTQNRDTRAIQLKLDEILRATARHELVKAEHLPDDDLTRIEEELIRARDEAMPPEPGG
ncbi:MAG: low affinity iron permease family protein [Gaiellaceae bacterium]